MSTSDYELIYWPGLPGRGEFIRVVFEEAGVPYTDKAVSDADAAVDGVMKLTGDNVGNEINPPFFAPPILRHNNLLISQTPNILQYIAPRVGLGPAEGPGVYHINGLVLTILDGLSNEAHDTHHPISVGLYYEDQKEESKKRAKDYTSSRVPKFLGHLEKVLEGKKSGDGPWLYGGELTYADLVLFQVSLVPTAMTHIMIGGERDA